MTTEIIYSAGYGAFFKSFLARLTEPDYHSEFHAIEEEINDETNRYFSQFFDTEETRQALRDAPFDASRIWPHCVLLPFFMQAVDDVLNALEENSKEPESDRLVGDILAVKPKIENHFILIDGDLVDSRAPHKKVPSKVRELPLPPAETLKKLSA